MINISQPRSLAPKGPKVNRDGFRRPWDSAFPYRRRKNLADASHNLTADKPVKKAKKISTTSTIAGVSDGKSEMGYREYLHKGREATHQWARRVIPLTREELERESLNRSVLSKAALGKFNEDVTHGRSVQAQQVQMQIQQQTQAMAMASAAQERQRAELGYAMAPALADLHAQQARAARTTGTRTAAPSVSTRPGAQEGHMIQIPEWMGEVEALPEREAPLPGHPWYGSGGLVPRGSPRSRKTESMPHRPRDAGRSRTSRW